jgi:hypothetical protein
MAIILPAGFRPAGIFSTVILGAKRKRPPDCSGGLETKSDQ